MWFSFLLVIYFFLFAYLFSYESYVSRDAWFPYLWRVNADSNKESLVTFYHYGLQYDSHEQYWTKECDNIEAYLLEPYFIQDFKLYYTVIFIIFYVVIFIWSQRRLSHFYLRFFQYNTFLHHGKTGYFLLYKQFTNFLYSSYIFYFNKIVFLKIFLTKLNYFFICWKPIFRKISYFGLFHASQAKWFLKNFNKRL